SIIAEYFDKTPTQWSYLGYLEAMKPYFDIGTPIQKLKSLWRKRFLSYLKEIVLKDGTSEEQRKTALFLVTQKYGCEISQFWNQFDLSRKLKAKQNEAQVNTQISALKVLDVATIDQADEFTKRRSFVHPDPSQLDKSDYYQNDDDEDIDNSDDNSTKINSMKQKKRKAHIAFDEKLDDQYDDKQPFTHKNINADQIDDVHSTSNISFASSSTVDDSSFDNDEKIKIDLTDITKQLEQEPLIEWVVDDIQVTRKFREYQRKVLNKASNEGLTWNDTYEVLRQARQLCNKSAKTSFPFRGLSSIIILCWPCPYPMFTTEEWRLIMKTNPYASTGPVFPLEVSSSLKDAVYKHWIGEDAYIYAGESILSKAVARSFNDIYESVPLIAPSKMTEDEHCYKILHPATRPFFLNSKKEYEVQLNRAMNGSKKRPDFSCVVNNVAFLISEIKPLGCTPLLRKKDSLK
ncbi:7121_t:CDS:2, partial [Funneliformis geosporum]